MPILWRKKYIRVYIIVLAMENEFARRAKPDGQ